MDIRRLFGIEPSAPSAKNNDDEYEVLHEMIARLTEHNKTLTDTLTSERILLEKTVNANNALQERVEWLSKTNDQLVTALKMLKERQ